MKSSANSDSITFVICAAGRGERFVQQGISKPKPLIHLNGKTMLERSIESLELKPHDQLIIISQEQHQLKEKFKDALDAEWVEINEITGGQLETFLFSKDLIQNDKIVIYNCDTYFKSSQLRDLIDSNLYDGIIPCSREAGESWSFCKVDASNNVLQVAEKKRISEWASAGYYYFKGKDLLINESLNEINDSDLKESYVAPLYEKYIQKGLAVKMMPVEKFLPFGTIDQVNTYWGVSLEELIAQNQ